MDMKKADLVENLDIDAKMGINLVTGDSAAKFGELDTCLNSCESLGTNSDNLKNSVSGEKFGDFSSFEKNVENVTDGENSKNSVSVCDMEKVSPFELGNGNFEKSNLVEKFGKKVKLEELDTSLNSCKSLGDDLKKNVSLENPSFEKVELLELANVEMADINSSFENEISVEKCGELGALNEGKKVKLDELDTSLDNCGADGDDLKKTVLVEKMGDLSTTLNDVKSEKFESNDSSSESESESESGSESESDSEDEGQVKEKGEEGEINDSDVEKMVEWSEDEFDGISKGPIKSRNELEDLPPVPPVEACLEPHHHTVPVGVISSIIGAQVIVEGVEQHNPLNEGTIFWITGSRSPLGLVDEIFGPVKGPFYIIRYNSENELPEGIKQGTSISFVPEFANHVLKDNLYKKGYDASGDNDEEISDDYEFSDDEKEAEYRKLQRTKKKRGTNEANCGNELKERKNFRNSKGGSSQHNQFSRGGSVQNNVVSKNRGGFVHNNAPHGDPTQVAVTQTQQSGTPVATSADTGNNPSPFVVGQNYGNSPMFIPQFQQTVPNQSFFPQPNVVWANGISVQQGMVFPNGVMWPQQNLLPNGVPLPQQFTPNQNFFPNSALPGTQPNFSGVPSFGSWPGPFAQSGPNQQFGVAMPINLNGQQIPPTGYTEMPQEFDQGANRGFSRGRGPHHKGGGRFGGGRGRQ